MKVEKIHEKVPPMSSRLLPEDWHSRVETNIEMFSRVCYTTTNIKSLKKSAVLLGTVAQKLKISGNSLSRVSLDLNCRQRVNYLISNFFILLKNKFCRYFFIFRLCLWNSRDCTFAGQSLTFLQKNGKIFFRSNWISVLYFL